MFFYTEVWNARPAWSALSVQDRISYLDRMEAGLRDLTDAGASLVGVVLEETPATASARYVAVWSMPARFHVLMLESILDAAGWHEYFERGTKRNRVEASGSLFRYGIDPSTNGRRLSDRRN